MNLGGSEPAYRGAPPRCPGCGELMRIEVTKTGEVDVCDRCGGLWIDWFDGDVRTLAAETEAARVERGTPLPPAADLAARPGSMACPRCGQSLSTELYRFADARDNELIEGVDLHRCADCAGAFVPRGSAHLLLDRAREGPPATGWDVVVELLRRLFRPGRKA